jgi:hypothetical protein
MDLGVAVANSFVNGLVQILAQMEPIRDLNRLRSPKTGSFLAADSGYC